MYATAFSPPPTDADPPRQTAEFAWRVERHGTDGLLVFCKHHSLDPWAFDAAILQNTNAMTPPVALPSYALPPFTAAKMIHSLATL